MVALYADDCASASWGAFFEYVRISYCYRNTEKIVKEQPQRAKKPVAMMATAVTLGETFSIMTVQQLDLIGIDAYADEVVNAQIDGTGNENVDNTVGTDFCRTIRQEKTLMS